MAPMRTLSAPVAPGVKASAAKPISAARSFFMGPPERRSFSRASFRAMAALTIARGDEILCYPPKHQKEGTVPIAVPAELRLAARRGGWVGSTAGQCPRYQQANLAVLPNDVAAEFAAF